MRNQQSGTWPTASDYSIAVQAPRVAFQGPLAHASVEMNLLGMPMSASGQNAVAFKLAAGPDAVAVRCFVREPSEGSKRYQALERHLRTSPCPVLAPAHWHDIGIRVDGDWWPIVRMPWVPGRVLNTVVEDHLDNADALRYLADRWRAAVVELQDARVAHGDLQHGNVLVDDDLEVKLIDLDGVWVPGMGVGAPNENGHPNYQHPGRELRHWGEGIDTFSALLIETSLRAIAADAALYDEFSNGENLVVTTSDLRSPGQTRVWSRLAGSSDASVRDAAALIERWCRESVPPTTPLASSTFDTGTSSYRPTPVGATRPTSNGAGNWWEQSAAATLPNVAHSIDPSRAPVTAASPAAPAPPVAAGTAPRGPLAAPGLVMPPPTPSNPAPPTDAWSTTGAPAAPAMAARRGVRAALGANAPIAGLVGGTVGGIVGAVTQGALVTDPDTAAAAPLFVALVASFLGAGLYAWQSVAVGAYAAGCMRLVSGMAVGAAAGLGGMVIADRVAVALITADHTRSPETVALVWGIVAACTGLAVGALTSARGAIVGFVGGALGGLVAGYGFGSQAGEFSGGRLLIDGSEPDVVLWTAVVCGFVGLCIGFMGWSVARAALTVIEGRGAGVQVIVSRRSASAGSSGRNTLVLAGDPSVLAHHVKLRLKKKAGAELVTLAPIRLNGVPVDGTATVAHGDILNIGQSYVRYEER